MAEDYRRPFSDRAKKIAHSRLEQWNTKEDNKAFGLHMDFHIIGNLAELLSIKASECPIVTRYPIDYTIQPTNAFLAWQRQRSTSGFIHIRDRAAGAKGSFSIAQMDGTFVAYHNEGTNDWAAFCTEYSFKAAVEKAGKMDADFGIALAKFLTDDTELALRGNETANGKDS